MQNVVVAHQQHHLEKLWVLFFAISNCVKDRNTDSDICHGFRVNLLYTDPVTNSNQNVYAYWVYMLISGKLLSFGVTGQNISEVT